MMNKDAEAYRRRMGARQWQFVAMNEDRIVSLNICKMIMCNIKSGWVTRFMYE